MVVEYPWSQHGHELAIICGMYPIFVGVDIVSCMTNLDRPLWFLDRS